MNPTLTKILEWLFLRILVEWVLMRLLWGPWNLLVGIVWTITDDVAEDVVFARLFFGLFGSLCIVVWFSALPHVQSMFDVGILSMACAAVYALCAGIFAVTLDGRDQELFSFRR